MTTLLPAPINCNAPLTDLERLWLQTSAYYAVFNETVMEDTQWDALSVELWRRRSEGGDPYHPEGLSAFFCHSVGLQWPVRLGSFEEGENPLKTAMGVNWDEGLPAIVVEGIRKDGPKRLSLWRSRIRKLME